MSTHFWKPGKQVSYAVTSTCELAFILFGVEQGIVGNLIDGENFLNQFGHPTGSYLGIIVSIYTLGCFFGCIPTYYVGDYLGRRKMIALAMVLVIIGVVLQTSAYSVPHLMIGRFICGLGTGMETSSVPMYQAELSRPELRGRLVCSEALFVGIGLVYAYWFTYGMSFTSGAIVWRLPIATQIIFAVVVLGLTFTIPESPRFLYFKGRKEEAKQVLCYVFGKPETDPVITGMYRDIEEAMILESTEGSYSWKRLFVKDKAKTRHRVLLAYLSMFAQQVGGINLINYYITTVLINNVGLERNLAMILAGCTVICFTVGSLVPSFFSDSLGRRLPLVYGYFGCGVCMLLISILLSFQDNSRLKESTGSAAVAFFFLFQIIFGATGNCIPWVVVPEILPLHARAKGTAIGISANWLWNFFVVEITPTIITNIKWRSYLIFTVTNLAFSIMVYLFYPETKKLTLESIDKLFSENNTMFMGFVDHKQYRSSSVEEWESSDSVSNGKSISLQHVESVGSN
ncbi:Sugar transporter STL1 [Meyerozyma sp. JA9]|nr:Sugar transporter STL1 [Meyerozyma sp. JA9]